MTLRHLSLLLFLLPLALCSCTAGKPGGGASRVPTFNYVKKTEGGCADVFLHKGTEDQREVLWIAADKKKLQLLDPGSKTFDLAAAPDGLQVAVDLWEAAPRFAAYCNDISADTKKEATWHAKRGKVTITIHQSADKPDAGPRQYKVSARLEGVVFEDDAGRQATLADETITEVTAGWYAG